MNNAKLDQAQPLPNPPLADEEMEELDLVGVCRDTPLQRAGLTKVWASRGAAQ